MGVCSPEHFGLLRPRLRGFAGHSSQAWLRVVCRLAAAWRLAAACGLAEFSFESPLEFDQLGAGLAEAVPWGRHLDFGEVFLGLPTDFRRHCRIFPRQRAVLGSLQMVDFVLFDPARPVVNTHSPPSWKVLYFAFTRQVCSLTRYDY